MIPPIDTFWWAASFADLVTEIALIFSTVIGIVIFAIYFIMGGRWGHEFWHSGNRHLGIEFQNDGSVDILPLSKFGTLNRVKSGDKKNQLVIPRQNTSFKSRGSPQVSIVVGRGYSHQANPFVAEYIRRMGGAYPPEWSTCPPPKKASDTAQMYLMYCEWKATAERPTEIEKGREEFVNAHFTDVLPPILPNDQLDDWSRDRKELLGQIYEQSAKGSFALMLKQLQDPTTDDHIKNGIYEFLNGQIQSEPTDLWPTWIAGFCVRLQDVARFVEPVSGSEVTNAMNMVYEALRKENRSVPVALWIFIGLMCMFIGIGILYKLVAG